MYEVYLLHTPLKTQVAQMGYLLFTDLRQGVFSRTPTPSYHMRATNDMRTALGHAYTYSQAWCGVYLNTAWSAEELRRHPAC